MRNFTEAATIKDYLIVRPDGARQVSRDGKRSEMATCKFYLQVRQEGGLGKVRLRTCLRADTHRQAKCRQVHQLFGDQPNTIIEKFLACAGTAGRNETLAA